jgi:hypothetical protein
MTIIHIDSQKAVFDMIRMRRENRIFYGAITHSSIVCTLFFDRCLDMIMCHHPDIWSYGTGIFLISPFTTKETHSLSESRAYEWRVQAMHSHVFDYSLRNIEDECFGYFVRYTLEYRERMRQFKMELELRDIFLTIDELDVFEYIDLLVNPIQDVEQHSLSVKHLGYQKYDTLFGENELTKNHTNYQVYEQCNACISQSTHEIISFFFNVESNFDSDIRRVPFDDTFVFIPHELIVSNKNGECIVCLEEKKVMIWPCHIKHMTCEYCTVQLFARQMISCPMCRTHL